MKCPECGTKISAKHYDPEYEWYECPKCEGAFTVDEIEEARNEPSKSQKAKGKGNRSRPQGKKADRGGRAQRKNAGRANGKVSQGNRTRVVAKGKRRQTEIAEDEEAVAKFEEEILVPKVKQEGPTKHRDEIESQQVVNIWADELEDVYHELGMQIDTMNAQDKALIVWREIHHLHGASAREAEVAHTMCEEHS